MLWYVEWKSTILNELPGRVHPGVSSFTQRPCPRDTKRATWLDWPRCCGHTRPFGSCHYFDCTVWQKVHLRIDLFANSRLDWLGCPLCRGRTRPFGSHHCLGCNFWRILHLYINFFGWVQARIIRPTSVPWTYQTIRLSSLPWNQMPKRTPKQAQGTANEKRVYSKIVRSMTLGPWDTLWDHVSDSFELFVQKLGARLQTHFGMPFCRELTSAKRLHAARPFINFMVFEGFHLFREPCVFSSWDHFGLIVQSFLMALGFVSPLFGASGGCWSTKEKEEAKKEIKGSRKEEQVVMLRSVSALIGEPTSTREDQDPDQDQTESQTRAHLQPRPGTSTRPRYRDRGKRFRKRSNEIRDPSYPEARRRTIGHSCYLPLHQHSNFSYFVADERP